MYIIENNQTIVSFYTFEMFHKSVEMIGVTLIMFRMMEHVETVNKKRKKRNGIT